VNVRCFGNLKMRSRPEKLCRMFFWKSGWRELHMEKTLKRNRKNWWS